MQYFLIIFIFIIGCSNKTEKNQPIEQNLTQTIKEIKQNNKPKTKEIEIEDLIFIEKENNITYNFEKNKILVFLDNNKFSNFQVDELKKLNKRFYIINNHKIFKLFNIQKFPTIIITKDNNSTKKYEGFIPAEILQYEIKD